MRPSRYSTLALVGLLAACTGEGPFIDQEINQTISKPMDLLVKTGRLEICYDSKAQLSEAEALARKTCGDYGLQSRLRFNDPYQCRVSTPHRAIFQCYDPDMTNRLGDYLNPFDEQAVAEWQRRTGGTKGPAVSRGTVIRGAGPDLTAPLPQPTAPAAAAIVPEPAPAPQPQMQPAPPPPTPSPAPAPQGGFSLPMGSWGDSFDAQ